MFEVFEVSHLCLHAPTIFLYAHTRSNVVVIYQLTATYAKLCISEERDFRF